MLFDQIKDDLKKAQLARDEITTSTLRLLLSEINNFRISKGEDLTGQDILTVVQKEVKKRKEAAVGFRTGGREDQAAKEESEARVLQKYLPEQISDEELTKIVEDIINSIGAKSLADIGRVMSLVMSKVGQRVDGTRVSILVKAKLQANR